MIKLLNKTACCGCSACAQICPNQCISMIEDNEGFLYPHINEEICTDCGLCEKVCPVINQGSPREPLKVYAAKNKNEEIRMLSSSGGIFTLLAEYVINKGGVVFGAKFNEKWQVIHASTETTEGIADFRGSKYVQSITGQTYSEAEQFLKLGRLVLFCGTPCQIAGLKNYLRKEYGNLYTVDFVCHGVPSDKIWKKYLSELLGYKKNNQLKNNKVESYSYSDINNINFRDKALGWKMFRFSLNLNGGDKTILFSESLMNNVYLQGFLKYLYLRPSCHDCRFKELRSSSDIMLGDFWGIQDVMPEFDDDKGISLITINSKKAIDIPKNLDGEMKETTYDDIVRHNSAIKKSNPLPPKREYFMEKVILEDKSMIMIIKKIMKTSIYKKIFRYFRNIVLSLKTK